MLKKFEGFLYANLNMVFFWVTISTKHGSAHVCNPDDPPNGFFDFFLGGGGGGTGGETGEAYMYRIT